MTPPARVQAAIEVLDRWLAGERLEPALTNWGRANRYAGSGDRLAVRDLCYTAARRRQSLAWVGGAETGRGLMLGLARLEGQVEVWFTGATHAPAPMSETEIGQVLADAPDTVRLDCPDWLWDALGPEREAVLTRFQSRAPVFLRVNLARTDRPGAISALAAEGISAIPHPLAITALEVTEGARKIASTQAFLAGFVELQDAASQAVIEALGEVAGTRVLDFCAGGGGKSLALAALGAKVSASDSNPGRMRDLAPRAARAGAKIDVLIGKPKGTWDLVLVDAPCSGSGTWSRDPEAKWALTPDRLAAITALQRAILTEAANNVALGGTLAYVTCSLLEAETTAPVQAFVDQFPAFSLRHCQAFSPLLGGDGFSLALLTRQS